MTKIIKKNYIFIAITVGIVFIWRGIWGLADIYLFADRPVLSFSVSIVVGIIVLLLIDFDKKDISELSYSPEE